MKCYLPITKTDVDTDTITFIPHVISIPEMKLEDFIRQAASDIITLLIYPPPTSAPSIAVGNSTRNGLLQLATLLHTNTVPEKLLQKQQIRTLNAARCLQPTKPSTPSYIDTTKQYALLDHIKQLTRVLNQKRLQTILHGRKQFKSGFH